MAPASLSHLRGPGINGPDDGVVGPRRALSALTTMIADEALVTGDVVNAGIVLANDTVEVMRLAITWPRPLTGGLVATPNTTLSQLERAYLASGSDTIPVLVAEDIEHAIWLVEKWFEKDLID